MDVNVLLFPDFEILDAIGPVEVLGCVEEYRLRYLSVEGGPVPSKQGAAILTEQLADADPSGILLVPGGRGTRTLVDDKDFIRQLGEAAAKSTHCLTVCTGSVLLAKTGLLDGRRATSNKLAFDWVESTGPAVQWVERARWIVDGKYHTSSGVSAGMDMTLGFVAQQFGEERARQVAGHIEYLWNDNPQHDPFARRG